MQSTRIQLAIWIIVAAFAFGATPADAQRSLSPAYAATDAPYTASERAGREIWLFSTANNHRFFTYSYPQRLGAAIDWYKVLNAEGHDDRFKVWGIINNPDCCVPGTENCPAQSLEETYGFEWCPGDDVLLQFVGREGYHEHDPACDFEDAPFQTGTPHGSVDQRQDPCDLYFGTSTGALGLRKFPNPRFDRDKWIALNGSAASWDNYRNLMADDPEDPDSRNTRIFDASVEPPFMIGMACGACHIAYDPLNPPEDPANPTWEQIKGLIGNQYSRVSEMLASGLSRSTLEFQLIGRARPGVVDTSALPMDYVNNPGTMNAIINFGTRPLHEHDVTKWYRAASCPAGADERQCWCEPGRDGKCWERKRQTIMAPNVLKGGEDSIGFSEAIQRVYFNIGSCAEQCWLNHIPDIRAADPTQRNHGQTPFEIAQCRRDCGSFRAIEDRLQDLLAFFLTARPTDLHEARGLDSRRDLVVQLEEEEGYGTGAVDRGRQIFAATCARCHSSQEAPYDNTDFHATDPNDDTLRVDWLGNDKSILASEVGTHYSRSLHSNHMTTRVWEEYASHTLRGRDADPQAKELMNGGGRGYYRNISLLSVWAHAPFMQNNAIGPELCGYQPLSLAGGAQDEDQYYVSPYVDAQGNPLPSDEAPACWPYDVSVEGRYELFKASMDSLLNPDKRVDKKMLLDRDVVFDVAPQMNLIGDLTVGISLRAPKDTPATMFNNLRFKDLIQDLALMATDDDALAEKYEGRLDDAQLAELKSGLRRMVSQNGLGEGLRQIDMRSVSDPTIQQYYSNSFAHVENAGHRFGEDLSDQQKSDLIAFLATL